jgi:hypothetical protein
LALRRGGRCLLALSAIAAAHPPSAGAQAPSGASASNIIVTVHQSSQLPSTYFDTQVVPGSLTNPGVLTIHNLGRGTATVRLDPVDGLTTDTLGSAYALTGSSRGATSWIGLGSRRLRLAPHAQVDVPLAIGPPSSAAPGDYLSGIAVQTVGQPPVTHTTGQMSIGEVHRYVVGVEMTVPGPSVHRIRFTGARVVRYPARVTFQLLARNAGNRILTNVHGQATVTDARGRVVVSEALGPGTFVTHSAIAYPVGAPGLVPAEGDGFRVRAVLYYSGGVARLDTGVTFGQAAANLQQNYVKTPGGAGTALWQIIALALGALMLLAGGWLVLAHRRRRSLSGRAAWAFLDVALAAARPEQPLSVVRIDTDPVRSDGRRRARRAAARRLRDIDRLCDLGPQLLLLVLPATSTATASGLAQDLAASLARDGILPARGALPVVTVTAATSSRELVAAVAAAGERVPA